MFSSTITITITLTNPEQLASVLSALGMSPTNNTPQATVGAPAKHIDAGNGASSTPTPAAASSPAEAAAHQPPAAEESKPANAAGERVTPEACTIDMARDATLALIKAAGRDAAVALLKEFGVDNAGKLKPDQLSGYTARANAQAEVKRPA